jgi:hypothetical protein
MTISVKIEHCNETVPKYLLVETFEDNGKLLSSLPIGPGGVRHVTVYGKQVIHVTEMAVAPVPQLPDLEN